MEGTLIEVTIATIHLVSVINQPPKLVPLDERHTLLTPHNPLSCPIEEGQWVRCKHGLYKHDIGFVCEHDAKRYAETTVALIPRIPEKSKHPRPTKRKKMARPSPKSWTAAMIEAEWGEEEVQRIIGSDGFHFKKETYQSGLILKKFPSNYLELVLNAPLNISPFLKASYLYNKPTFTPWLHWFVQDTLTPGQHVQVESGGFKGSIGFIHSITDSAAMVNLTKDALKLQISLRALMPHYVQGDHVKHRWSDSSGVITSVDMANKRLTFVNKEFQLVSISCSTVYMFINQFFQIQVSMDIMEPFRDQLIIEIEDLEVSRSGPSLPKVSKAGPSLSKDSRTGPSPSKGSVHPLLGKMVQVTCGPFKGYFGHIRNIRKFEKSVSFTVEFEAVVGGIACPHSTFNFHEFKIMYESFLNILIRHTLVYLSSLGQWKRKLLDCTVTLQFPNHPLLNQVLMMTHLGP